MYVFFNYYQIILVFLVIFARDDAGKTYFHLNLTTTRVLFVSNLDLTTSFKLLVLKHLSVLVSRGNCQSPFVSWYQVRK